MSPLRCSYNEEICNHLPGQCVDGQHHIDDRQPILLCTPTDHVVDLGLVEGHVDGECGGVVMWTKTGLAFGVVPDNKVHDCMSLQRRANKGQLY